MQELCPAVLSSFSGSNNYSGESRDVFGRGKDRGQRACVALPCLPFSERIDSIRFEAMFASDKVVGREWFADCCPAVRSLQFYLLWPDIQKMVNISGKRGSLVKERGRQGTFHHFSFSCWRPPSWFVNSCTRRPTEMLWNQSSSDSRALMHINMAGT